MIRLSYLFIFSLLPFFGNGLAQPGKMIYDSNRPYSLTPPMWLLVVSFFSLTNQSVSAFPKNLTVPVTIGRLGVASSDTLKKPPAKLRTSTAQASQSANKTPYSAPGHYTVTVPRDNGPGGKADLVLVNGTKQVDRIGDVDANTIESIEVFKDTKTIAKYKVLYGDIANKGVVIIHLKHKTL